jgi:hypothetical protein
MNPIDCINTASDHSVCSAIGDEIAALYEHMDHCRGANCLYAKNFYDEFHSSCELDTLLCTFRFNC